MEEGLSPEGEVGMTVVVVQLSSGCGRNEWNAAVGQGSSGGEVEGAMRRGWQSCSVRATTIECVVDLSQDGIGTINMVMMGKGELHQGRVSADIWRPTDSGWRCHPQRHGLRARPSLARGLSRAA